MSVTIEGPIAFLPNSGSAVFFSKGNINAGVAKSKGVQGTNTIIGKIQNALDIAYWGEDNRFPQNIEQQMAYCSVGKFGLDWKARRLWANGIIPGRVTGYKDDGSEIFAPLDRSKEKAIYDFIENRKMYRFWMEYLQDWTWYANCFPEAILSKDAKSIAGWVHQESCEARYKQMNQSGIIDTVYLSKFWGAAKDQFVKFDPKKAVKGLSENPSNPDMIDPKFIKKLDCVDMYNPVESLQEIATKLRNTKGLSGFKSAIFPVNYPSVNKTYYQLAAWDGARLSGWVEIASKIPALLKALFNKAFRLRYHIEVPENYFSKKYGQEVWNGMDDRQQSIARKKLLEEMDNFLSSEENAFKSFISFFEITSTDKTEFGRIKITEIPDKSNLDKEMITQSAADHQILVAMGEDPTLSGAGSIGSGQQRSGGSDKREGFLIYEANLNLERNVMLEPLYLTRDFNGWDSDIVFRISSTILTTLDTGAGTKKIVS